MISHPLCFPVSPTTVSPLCNTASENNTQPEFRCNSIIIAEGPKTIDLRDFFFFQASVLLLEVGQKDGH